MTVNMNVIIHFFSGTLAMASLTVGVMFLRLWTRTYDRLFLIFAVAFALLGAERFVLSFTDPDAEFQPYIYLIRLMAFLAIIAGIVDKNLRRN